MPDRNRSRSARAALAALAGTSFPALACLYAALFAAFGVVSPFMPSFLAVRGLDPQAIATVFAAGTLARIAAGPPLGTIADRYGTRSILALAALGAGTIGLLYLKAASLPALAAVSVAHASAIASLNPLADAVALAGSARERSFSYGAVRGIGSAAYVLATLGCGLLVARAGLSSIIFVSSALFLAMLPAIPRLPPTDGRQSTANTTRQGLNLARAIGAVLAPRAFGAALVAAALVIGSQSMSDTFAVIHWRAAGLRPATVSVLLAGAVCSEIVVFLLIGPFLVRRFGPAACAALSELLQGLTFALMHLAVMAVIAAAVPPRLAATAQTLYGTMSLGLASAIVTAASGAAYARLGGQAFLLMSGLCLLALPVTRGMRIKAAAG